MKRKQISKPVKVTKASKATKTSKAAKPAKASKAVKVSKPTPTAKPTKVVALSKPVKGAVPPKGTLSPSSPAHIARQLKSYTPFPGWLSAADQLKRQVSGRAGVSSASLDKNGIHRPSIEEIKACYDDSWEAGFVIPYYKLPATTGAPRDRVTDTYISSVLIKDSTERINVKTVKPYVRIRFDKPINDAKYKQAYGTTQHVYIPNSLDSLCCKELVIVEGEIKAISLVEEGIPAVGIGGIYGIQAKKDIKNPEFVKLIPELKGILNQLGVEKVYYLGDGDTSLNWQFSDAAVKYSSLLAPLPVYLPRIPLDEPKGIDDVKAIKKTGFLSFWKKITKAASLVAPLPLTNIGTEELLIKTAEFRKRVNTLCFQLLDEQMDVIAGPKDIDDDKLYFYKFTQIYLYIKGSKDNPNTEDLETFFKLCADAQFSIKAIQEADKLSYKANNENRKKNRGKKVDLPPIEKLRLKAKIFDLHNGKVAPAQHPEPGGNPQYTKKLLPLVLLPGGDFVPFHESARSLFKKLKITNKYFMVNGAFMHLERNEALQENGKPFTVLDETGLQTRVSKDVRFGYQERDEYDDVVIEENKIPSNKQLKTFIHAAERHLLPKITGIHKSPILVSVDKRIKVLQKGYSAEAGGRYILNGVVANVPLKEAVDNLKGLLAECPFASPSDYSRALCALISPALVFGKLFPCFCPAFMFEADGSQAGKGILATIVQRVYGENGYVIAPKEKGGVGSLDEILDQALLFGEPFIQYDNFRDSFSSGRLESILTVSAGQEVLVRVPHQNTAAIDPSGRIFHITSNGLSITPDLANRLCIIKLRKSDKQYSKNRHEMEMYIGENQETLLGSVFAVIKAWVEADEQFTNDSTIGVGGFQQWWQTMEWICTNIFHMPSPYVGVASKNKSSTNEYLIWLRKLAIEVKKMGYNDKELTPTLISDICLAQNICVIGPDKRPLTMNPGVVGKSLNIILKVFGQTIPDGAQCDVDGDYTVKHVIKPERREKKGDIRDNSYYVFSGDPSVPQPALESAGHPPVPHVPHVPPPSAANGTRPITFGKIDKSTMEAIARLSLGGPSYAELLAKTATAGIAEDVATSAIVVMVNTGQLCVFDDKFFPNDADGNTIFSSEDASLVQKIAQSGNSDQIAMLLRGDAYQLLTQGKLPDNHPRALRSFQDEQDPGDGEAFEGYWESDEVPAEEEPSPRQTVSNSRLERLLALAKSPIPR